MRSKFVKRLNDVYQSLISPGIHLLAGPGMGCRFYPTCSEYCLECFDVHGFFHGSYLSLRRVLRCNPLGRAGHDPVPASRLNLLRKV